MSNAPIKTDYGLYPATPGFRVQLGDYGVWKGKEWCRLGNINNDFGLIFFNKTIEETDTIESCDCGVTISSGTSIDGPSDNATTGTELSFNANGSIHYKAHITKIERFSSIQNEVFSFMKKYLEQGIWDSKYWIAVEINYADNLLSFQSSSKGSKVRLHGNIEDELNLAKADFNLNFKYEKASINCIQFNGVEQFAGAKFVGFDRTGLFKKTYNPGYQGEAFNFEIASEQSTY